MIEITNVALENEMDLILAHKQSMKLAELTGLSLPSQTTFATAVSEVCRSVIGKECQASLTLNVSDKQEKVKYIIAALTDNRYNYSYQQDDGYKYAKRLVPHIDATISGHENTILLYFRLAPSTRVNDNNIEKWRIQLNTDPEVSPYEEIKRKNRQLIELADKLRESEKQYQSLTDSLPMMIFSMTASGMITYANQWLNEYTGHTIAELNSTHWRNIVHPDEFEEIWENWTTKTETPRLNMTMERRLKEINTGEYRWHTGTIIPITDMDDNITSFNVFMVDIQAQKMIEAALTDNQNLKIIQAELEEKVNLLNRSNQQLEQFAYVASHDLQEPLRKIILYGDYIKERYSNTIPKEGIFFFNSLISAADRMKILIKDILTYSIVRSESITTVDLNQVFLEAKQDLEISIIEKQAVVSSDTLPIIQGNARQLKQLFENLISNSLKFAQQGIHPVISITSIVNEENMILHFKDNGIGFEEQYIAKLFTLFQRLNARDKYAGTGIGLAICKKITDLHNGTITATSRPDEGATFIITLPLKQQGYQVN